MVNEVHVESEPMIHHGQLAAAVALVFVDIYGETTRMLLLPETARKLRHDLRGS